MSPSYSSTLVDPEDAIAFVDGVSFTTKADLYAAEGEAIAALLSEMIHAIDLGQITARALCERDALTNLHRGCYAGIWTWAGAYRAELTDLDTKNAAIVASNPRSTAATSLCRPSS